jgi:hypothetical protein
MPINNDKTTKIDMPEGVVDEKAYKALKAFQKLPVFTTKKTVELSDGTDVQINQMFHHYKKKIAHLPLDEQEILIEKKIHYQSLCSKLAVLKRKAFGANHDMGVSVIVGAHHELVMGLLGRYFTYSEIAKQLQEEHGIEASTDMVERYAKRHKEEIKAKQDEFQQSYTDVRLFVKRSRLEELLWLYTNRKDKYTQTQNREDYKLLLQTLEQVRKESEGEILNVVGNLNVNVEVDIRNHLKAEVFKGIGLKEIILGRIAARQGIPVERLIASINNSYYNRLNSEEVTDVEYTKFPSSETYDFGAIERKNNLDAKNKEKEVSTAVVVTDKASSIKEAFLAKIKAKQAGMQGNAK